MDRKETLQQRLQMALDEMTTKERIARVVIPVLEKMSGQAKVTKRVVTALEAALPGYTCYFETEEIRIWGKELSYNNSLSIRGNTWNDLIESAKRQLPECNRHTSANKTQFEFELTHLDEILSAYEDIEKQIEAFKEKFGRLDFDKWNVSYIMRDVLSLIK